VVVHPGLKSDSETNLVSVMVPFHLSLVFSFGAKKVRNNTWFCYVCFRGFDYPPLIFVLFVLFLCWLGDGHTGGATARLEGMFLICAPFDGVSFCLAVFVPWQD
jgi:hypothetical protein